MYLRYRAQLSTLRFSIQCVSTDSLLFSTVRKYRLSTLRYRAWLSTQHTSLTCANMDAPLFITVREYRLHKLFYLAQISLPCVSIDSTCFSTVRKYRRSSLRYRAWVSIDSPHFSTVRKYRHSTSSLPRVSIDAPHFSNVRKCRRPTLCYRAWVSTPHNSIPLANIDAKHLVTVRREYWSNLLPYLVYFLFKKKRRGGSGYLLFWPSGWELVHSKQWCISACCFGLFWSSIETVPFDTHETQNKVNTWNITSFLFSKYAIFLFHNFNSLNTLPL